MCKYLVFEPGMRRYLFRQLAPLLFRDVFEFGECVLAEVDAPPVSMADECAIHGWIPLCIPMVVLLIQPEEQAWPPRLWWHEGVMVEVPMEEVSVGMCPSYPPNPWERRDSITAINSADIRPGDDQVVVGESAPIHIEGWAEFVQTAVEQLSLYPVAFNFGVSVRLPLVALR